MDEMMKDGMDAEMGGAGEKEIMGMIHITQYADGSFDVAKGIGDGDEMEDSEDGESMATPMKPAKDARELMMVVKGMLDESSGVSAQEAFDAASTDGAMIKKPAMKGVV